MSYRNAGRHRHTKGVVLFTVVAIMLFLLIMVMSTLSVVSSAQKRTYTKFKENQAYFTARSGLESVTTTLWNYTYNGSGDREDPDNYDDTNNELYKQFLQMMYPAGTPTSPKRSDLYVVEDTDLTFDEMDDEDDIVKITVEFPQPPASTYNGADLKYLYGECKVYIQKTSKTTARFISHATLGDSESTIILYIGPKNEPPEVFENALTTFGGAGADNMAVFGGTSVNIGQTPTGNPTDLNTVEYTNSGTTIQGNQYFNCNIKMNQSTLYLGENGTIIAGDLELGNNASLIAPEEDTKLYIGGKFSSNTGPTIGSADSKVDLYCNGFDMGNTNFNLYGNLYIYGDEDVTIKGTIHGDVYYEGTGTITFENATIDGDLYTNSTNITKSNGLNINGVDLKDADLSTITFSTAADIPDIDEVLAGMPTLENTRATYEPLDGDTSGDFNAWGYKKIGDGEEKNDTNYKKYVPDEVPTYISQDGWVEWPGFDSLDTDPAYPGFRVIDATTNDINYHVSTAYCDYNRFIPDDRKLIIKGKNNVNFYFEEGNYTFGNRAIVTNESIYNNTSGVVLTTDGANNVELNINMFFWGSSQLTIQNDGQVNAYMLAPNGKLVVTTANQQLKDKDGGVTDIQYDGITVANNTILGMGSLVFNEIDCSNAPKYFFVRKPSSTPDPNKPGKFWQDIYYFNR